VLYALLIWYYYWFYSDINQNLFNYYLSVKNWLLITWNWLKQETVLMCMYYVQTDVWLPYHVILQFTFLLCCWLFFRKITTNFFHSDLYWNCHSNLHYKNNTGMVRLDPGWFFLDINVKTNFWWQHALSNTLKTAKIILKLSYHLTVNVLLNNSAHHANKLSYLLTYLLTYLQGSKWGKRSSGMTLSLPSPFPLHLLPFYSPPLLSYPTPCL